MVLLQVEMGTFDFFSFPSFILRERPLWFVFFQSLKKIILFVLKIIVYFSSIYLTERSFSKIVLFNKIFRSEKRYLKKISLIFCSVSKYFFKKFVKENDAHPQLKSWQTFCKVVFFLNCFNIQKYPAKLRLLRKRNKLCANVTYTQIQTAITLCQRYIDPDVY